jgi:FdhD protein
MQIQRLDEGPEPPLSPGFSGRLFTADGRASPAVWQLPAEAALAILVNGRAFAVMMATPTDLEDFAVGFALTEGLVPSADRLDGLRIAEASEGYVLNLTVAPALADRLEGRRRTLAGRAGCGLCGAQTLDAALPPLAPVRRRRPAPAPAAVLDALRGLPAWQVMKRDNRSTHAAGFARPDGTITLAREDIGRHNALDKLAGAGARAGLDPSDGFVVLSSRLSVEMVQKTVAMGAGLVASASAPSALALTLASRAGLAVAAMARDGLMIFDTDRNREKAA